MAAHFLHTKKDEQVCLWPGCKVFRRFVYLINSTGRIMSRMSVSCAPDHGYCESVKIAFEAWLLTYSHQSVSLMADDSHPCFTPRQFPEFPATVRTGEKFPGKVSEASRDEDFRVFVSFLPFLVQTLAHWSISVLFRKQFLFDLSLKQFLFDNRQAEHKDLETTKNNFF